MRFEDLYSVIVTPHHRECRDFYVRWLAGEVVFDSSWFILIALPGDTPRHMAFMTPDHPSSPPSPAPFVGDGMFLTMQVENAAAEYERLRAAGATFAYDLRDEPWGQRRFALRDPAGVWLDIVQQTEPAAGFWDSYIE